VLAAHLATRSHIVGDPLTLADFDIAGPFSQNERTKILLDEFPNFVGWQRRLLDTVPAWAATKRDVDDRIDSARGGRYHALKHGAGDLRGAQQAADIRFRAPVSCRQESPQCPSFRAAYSAIRSGQTHH
jgi:hypothetical protein